VLAVPARKKRPFCRYHEPPRKAPAGAPIGGDARLAAVGRRITHRGTYTVTVGHSHLQDHDRSEAVGYLEQAQEVYRRIGTPDSST